MTTSTDSPRLVLEGVPKVEFHQGGAGRCPEDSPFISCLRAYLDFIGEGDGTTPLHAHDTTWQLDTTYAYLMGTSGAAFFLSWRPGWHGDNVDIHNMAVDTSSPFVRACAAVGYTPEFLHKDDADAETVFLARIRKSLQQGHPVFAFGVVGPPECCLVTGYDEDGAVLIGWNYFQQFPEFNAGVEYEPAGYFRKRGWFAETEALMLLGEKHPRPPREDVYRDALHWGLQVMRTPRVYDRHNGHAAYSAWADALQHDDEFPAGDLPVLFERLMVHDDAVGSVAENRWYGSRFLLQAAAHLPALADDLHAAAQCFVAEHDFMWQAWGLVGGIGRSELQANKLAEPDVRRRIIPLIQQAQSQDIEAATHIERALARSV